MRQMDLFDETDYEKLKKRDAAVDQIRRRYGIDSVKRAAFTECPIDHMSGGISREKRSVDYTKIMVSQKEGNATFTAGKYRQYRGEQK